MATTFLDQRLLDYADKATKNVEVNKLFVSYYLATERGIELKNKKLSELFVKVKKGNNTVIRNIKSYDEFISEQSKANVFTESSAHQPLPANGEVVLGGKKYVNRTEPYYALFDLPNDYETTEEYETTKLIDNKLSVVASSVPYGLSRTMKVQENELSKENNFLMVVFDKSSKQDFVKKSEIYYMEGSTIVYLYENGKNIDFSKVKGKTLYAKNKIIDNIYTEKEFTFTEYKKFDNVIVDERIKATYSLIENPTAEQIEKVESGEVIEFDGKYYEKTNEHKEELYFAEHMPTVLNVPNPKKPGETIAKSYYAVKIYEADKNGTFVQIRIKGHTKDEMIHVSSLCDMEGNAIQSSNLAKFVGKSIKVLVAENVFEETEPLTYEQSVYFFSKRQTKEKSVSDADILAENAFLQTANGDFVAENLITPIAYKFTNKEVCDAYLLKVQTTEGVKEKVVQAKDYSKAKEKYTIKGAYKLETSSLKDGKVVQTTSAGNIAEDCKVVGAYDEEKDIYNDLSEEDSKLMKESLLTKFDEDYRNGQYIVNHLYNENGEKIELDYRHIRYIDSDTHYMEDYASNTLGYRGLKTKDVTFDAKTGKFKGGEKFSFTKACKEAYAVWGRALGAYLAINMSGAGLLACLAAPALVVGAAAALVAAVPGIPIVTGAVWFAKNVLKRPFKDKTKYNRKKWHKQFNKDLEFINESMKDTEITKGLSREVMLAKIESVKSDILGMSSCVVGNGFQIIDGEIVVTGENVNQVRQFKKEHKKELKHLRTMHSPVKNAEVYCKKLYAPFEKSIKDGKIINEDSPKYKKYLKAKADYEALLEEYKKEENSFNRKLSSGNIDAKKYPVDPKQKSELKRADRLKQFWLVKKFTSKQELLEKGFTEEEIAMLDNLSYEPTNDMFLVKGEKYNADTCKPKVKLYTEHIEIPEAEQEVVDLLTKLKNAMEETDKVEEFVNKEPKAEVPSEDEVHKEETEKDHEEEKELEKDKILSIKPEKPKAKRINKHIINSENALVRELEDSSSATYEYVLNLITKSSKKFKLSIEEAKATIFNFTIKVNEAHDNGMHAKDVFEKGSIEAYILTYASNKMKNEIMHNN